jgi:hypothetical protein
MKCCTCTLGSQALKNNRIVYRNLAVLDPLKRREGLLIRCERGQDRAVELNEWYCGYSLSTISNKL